MAHKLVYVCEGGDCTEYGSGDLFENLRNMLKEHDPEEERFRVRRYPCFGGCEVGINVAIHPDKIFYSKVKDADLPELVEHLVSGGSSVDRLEHRVEEAVAEMVWQMLDSPY